jgi:hypothetical protein
MNESYSSPYLFLLWPKENLSKVERRERLLNQCAPEILSFDINHLRINIDDNLSSVKSPAPKWYKGDALVATASLISTKADRQIIHKTKRLFENAGFLVGAYIVEQSIYKDYGDNQHFRKRDWNDGERSPTEQAVTLLTKPKKFSQEEWIQRWHGNMSPVSEVLQPRARYVRNVVLENIDNSPAFDGVVEEAWPSPAHITNLYLFYCAESSTWKLIKNMLKLLLAVMHFHQLHKIRTVTMSEYFLKTDIDAS